MNLRQEARARALQRLERERAGDVGGLRETLRARIEPERAERGHELRPVDEREPFLRLQPHRLEPDRLERRRPGQPPPVDPGLALADQRQREMGERREVAAGADRAPARNVREHAAVEALDQKLHGHDARAGVALGERVGAQQHRRAHDLVRVRLADAARVAAQEPQLELLGQLLRNRARDEPPEAGVDAVGVLLVAVRGALDELAGRAHALPRASSARAPSRVDGDAPRRRREPDRRPSAPCSRSRCESIPRLSALRPQRLRVEQPQLEHARGVESVDPERRPCRGHGRARRHQADELGADHLRPALAASCSTRATISWRAAASPVLDVHAHLHEPCPRQVEPERPHAREAAAALADERRDLPRRVERRRAG